MLGSCVSQTSMPQCSAMGTLYCGDCLEVLERKIEPESVDLIYADPPFFSNRQYEVIWGDEGEIRSFEDRWEGGVEVYADWMAERLRACHRVLKPAGAIYLHCDWHASHYLRVRLDEVFGRDRFLNEIIWCYSVGGKSKKRWARKHDTIFYYAKGKQWHFDGAAAGVKRRTGTKSFGGKIGVDSKGRRYQDKLVKKTGKYYRYYLDAPKIPEDWWTDINSIQSQSAERLGYPTQKPEALLERIIKASSRKGDLVLDPFCGCGTALAVAQRLERKWVGVDISPTAVRVIRQRLAKIGAPAIESIGLPTTIAELRALKPFEFQNWVIREKFNGTVGPKGSDKGIDGYTFMLHEPIQVKQSSKVGRVPVDNFVAAVRRARKRKGYFVAFGFTRSAYEEAAAVKRRNGVEIILLIVEDLLHERPYEERAAVRIPYAAEPTPEE